uniref:BTB domain-containing protein n=1 Tax=Panagrolaimus sp. ES5 TaxID=591445 RepID=A0AC34G416_9BILA
MEAENKKLHSESVNAFNIPGVQYYISISLNDEEQDRRGEAWIFFYLHFSDEIKIESDFTITIESANYHTNCNYVFEKSIGWGEMIGTTKELFDPQNRYIVDGKLTFKVEGTLMVEKGLPKKAETFGDHCNALCLNLWNQEENKDFTIVAGGKEIAAHKCVIAARSSVFARMFESGLIEAQENEIVIEDFSYKIVEMAIKFFYHQSLVPYDDLEDYLISKIDESNVCRLTNCSILSNTLKLKMKCAEFIQICLKASQPLCDLDILDENFALNLFKNAFSHVVKIDM